jgi:filamentous hemagglutinin family protein
MKLTLDKLVFLYVNILLNLLDLQSATAQIIPDRTLGNENSIKNTQSNLVERIEGGARRNSNLLHSFLEFNIKEGQKIYFANPEGVVNIVTRVTGGNISEILGTLGVDGNANLFLINPNGIFFGQNAQLDLRGSFLASTASSIKFADGYEFSATSTQSQPLLTISTPVGLSFDNSPGRITNLSNVKVVYPDGSEDLVGLRVQPDKTLALIGGEISIDGGYLSTEGGRIELGSVAGNNVVSLNSINQNWTLNYDEVLNYQNISLLNKAYVASSGLSSGDLQIIGKQIILGNGSRLGAFAVNDKVGNVIIKASELVKLEENSSIINLVLAEADGKDSKLAIETEQLILKDGSQISSVALGTKQGANLQINASEIFLEGFFFFQNNDLQPSGLFARFEEPGTTGSGGALTIQTERLIIKNGAQVTTETFGAGQAGDLIVNASELVELTGTVPGTNFPSALSASVGQQPTATGNGGKLTINTARLIVRDGAQISTTAQNTGSGGILNINASDSILLSGKSSLAEFRGLGRSGIFVNAEPILRDEQGNPLKDELGNFFVTTADAGQLNLTTKKLIVENGATISADNFGTGTGANVNLNVDRLILRDGGQIGAGSLLEKRPVDNERGNGGTLTVNASEFVEITGTGKIGDTIVNSSLFTQAKGTGDAGNLTINTPQLNIRGGAEITAKATGDGQAGSVTVNADTIALDRGKITASTNNGTGGNVFLNANNLLLLSDNSQISAEANNLADGGNVEIDTPFVVAFPNQDNDIIAKAQQGNGGEITINNQRIFGLQERKSTPQNNTNDIDASSEFGNNGTVTIVAPEVDPTSAILELPSTPIDAESLIARDVCRLEDGKIAGGSSFIITGKGGLPPSAEDPLINSYRIVEWETLPEESESNAVAPQNSRHDEKAEESDLVIQQAQGWKRASDGTLLLTADATTATPQSPDTASPQCQSR